MRYIRDGLSPELISGRLRLEFRSHQMRVSHETIYRWVIADAVAGGYAYKVLIRHHKYRRKQHMSTRRRLFEGRVSIIQRSKIVANKRQLVTEKVTQWKVGNPKGVV